MRKHLLSDENSSSKERQHNFHALNVKLGDLTFFEMHDSNEYKRHMIKHKFTCGKRCAFSISSIVIRKQSIKVLLHGWKIPFSLLGY